jgi:hypothetical protein
MNIFKKAKLREGRRIFSNCHICKTEFKVDIRNRGWELFCSKSCSVKWGEKVKNKVI